MVYGETDWTNNTEYLNFPGLRYYHLTHTDSSGGGGGGGNASVFKIHCDVTSESAFNYYENFSDILTAYNEGKMLQMVVGGGSLGTSLVSTSYVYTVDDSTNVNGFIFYFSTIGPLFYYFGISSDVEQHGAIEASTIPAIIPSDGIDYLDNSYIRIKNDSSVLNFLNDGRLTIKYDSSAMSVNNKGLSIKYDGTLKKTNSGLGVNYNNTLTNNNGLGIALDSGDAVYVNNGLDVKIDGYTISKNTNGYLRSCFYEDITYGTLVQKRDNGALVKGAQYRIVDYVTTTSQVNTLVSGIDGGGGIENHEEYHQFDIIVTADSENVLNENARAVWHDGDEYFALSNLAAWELKYCLDNDDNRFTWAFNKGKGVIYYMKDEFGNECPYDFKNIKFRMSTFKDADPLFLFDYDVPTYQISKYFFQGVVKMSVNNDRRFYTGIKHICDFSNDEVYTYTFSRDIEGGDSTVVGDGLECIAKMNIIKPTKINYIISNKPFMTLPSNVFIGNCYNNIIGDNCFLNTFYDCDSNKLSNSYGNIFMGKCSCNELNNSDCNAFGVDCNRNKIEGGYYNILLSQCNDNILKNDCNTLICADKFTNNLIENGTNHVKFGFYGNDINQKPMQFYNFDFADGSVYYHQGGVEFLNACCSTGGNINTFRTNVIYYGGDPNNYYFYAMRFGPNALHPAPLLDC